MRTQLPRSFFRRPGSPWCRREAQGRRRRERGGIVAKRGARRRCPCPCRRPPCPWCPCPWPRPRRQCSWFGVPVQSWGGDPGENPQDDMMNALFPGAMPMMCMRPVPILMARVVAVPMFATLMPMVCMLMAHAPVPTLLTVPIPMAPMDTYGVRAHNAHDAHAHAYTHARAHAGHAHRAHAHRAHAGHAHRVHAH
eukprot:gene1618-biopygen5225